MSKSAAVKRVMFIPDIHVPDHDKSAIKIALEFQKDFKPDYTVCLGDLMSADQASSFVTEDEIDLEREFEMANDIIDKFKFTHFLEGNHCERLRRRGGMIKKSLRSLVDVRRNLKINERGIHWRPYHPVRGVFKFGKLTALHGFFTNEYAARKHADAYGCCVFGHTHRVQEHQPKNAFVKHTGFNIGCLCRTDLPYMDNKPPTGWCQAFSFAYLFKSGHFSHFTTKIVGSQVCINGKVYSRRAA